MSRLLGDKKIIEPVATAHAGGIWFSSSVNLLVTPDPSQKQAAIAAAHALAAQYMGMSLVYLERKRGGSICAA